MSYCDYLCLRYNEEIRRLQIYGQYLWNVWNCDMLFWLLFWDINLWIIVWLKIKLCWSLSDSRQNAPPTYPRDSVLGWQETHACNLQCIPITMYILVVRRNKQLQHKGRLLSYQEMITLQFHASWWITSLRSRMLTISVSDNTDCHNNAVHREIKYDIVSD